MGGLEARKAHGDGGGSEPGTCVDLRIARWRGGCARALRRSARKAHAGGGVSEPGEMAFAAAWQNKLSFKMAVVSLLLPIPALTLGSLLWSSVPRPYMMLHHGGTMDENVAWLHGHHMPPAFEATMKKRWEGALHAPRARTFNGAEAEHLDIPEDQLVELERIFTRHSRGGAIGLDELAGALRDAGVFAEAGHKLTTPSGEPVLTDMQALINRWDRNENGVLDQTEFLDLAATKQRDVAGLQEAFDAFDEDDDGEISYSTQQLAGSSQSELARASNALFELRGRGQHRANFDEAAKAADSDGNGSLNRQEFASMILAEASHPCMGLLYIDKESMVTFILCIPLVLSVVAAAIALVGGLQAVPRHAPVLIVGLVVCYLGAMFLHAPLLRRGVPSVVAGAITWAGLLLPAGFFCSECFRHAGLRASGLAVLVVWLAVMAQLVDWTYRHLFRFLLSHSIVGGGIAITLAVGVPPMLNMLNSVFLTREWRKVEPAPPFERSRPFFLFAYITVARAQREMLADIYVSPAAHVLAYPAVLAIGASRYYTSRAAAKLVDKGVEPIPNAATKGIASGWAELWAVGAVGAAHLVSAGSCAARHHQWGTVSPGFVAFVVVQLAVEFCISVVANGMLLHEGVRVDKAQRSLRRIDKVSDLLVGTFATALVVSEGDRCAALLQAVCGAFHHRISK